MTSTRPWQTPGVQLLRTAAAAEGGNVAFVSERTDGSLTCFQASGPI